MAERRNFRLILSSVFRQYFEPALQLLPKQLLRYIYLLRANYFLKKTRIALEKHSKSRNSVLALPKGVNLFGNMKSNLGLGQHARLISAPIIVKKVPLACINSHNFLYEHLSTLETDRFIVNTPIYNCNLVTLSISKFAEIYGKPLKDNNFFSGRYNILYNAWEWNKYSTNWMPLSNKFNEFWAMSHFVKETAERALDIPVLWMPYCVEFPDPPKLSRKFFGLTNSKFTFLFSYDFFSNIHRKNPLAVIKAFLIAFPTDQDVELVIKVSMLPTSIAHRKELRMLKGLIGNDARIKILDQVLSNDHMKSLMNTCDVYVSLHRAEGFGLGMAESMKSGKAVIATNYSGNTDFTKADTACLVGYKLIDVKPSESIYYEKGQVWADPCIEEAAAQMKSLYEDTELYKKISKSGQNFILQNYNSDVIGERFVKRLKCVGVL